MSIYKGNKLVAGRNVDTYLVRRPAWNQAIELSPVDLTAGYKAPADGMIVGSFYYSGTGRDYFFTLNGDNIMPLLAKKGTNGDITRPLTLSLTVNQGDIMGCTALSASDIELSPSIKFVPFEDSTVSESNVEVVTPELIRNLHDPDWSQAVSITAAQLVEGYTVPKRGIIVGSIWSSKYTNAYKVSIEINNVSVLNARITDKQVSYGNIQCPVCANDIVRLVNIPADYCSYNISFVPYKAQ